MIYQRDQILWLDERIQWMCEGKRKKSKLVSLYARSREIFLQPL